MAGIGDIQAGKASIEISVATDKLNQGLAEAKRRVAEASEKLVAVQQQIFDAADRGDKEGLAASRRLQKELEREIKLYKDVEKGIKSATDANVERGQSGGGSGSGLGRMPGIPRGVGVLGGVYVAGKAVGAVGNIADSIAAVSRGDKGAGEALVKSIPVIGNMVEGIGKFAGAVTGATTALAEFKKAQEETNKVVDLNKQRFARRDADALELARLDMTADQRSKDDIERAYQDRLKQINADKDQYAAMGGSNAAKSMEEDKALATALRDRKLAEIDNAAAAKAAAKEAEKARKDNAAVASALRAVQTAEIANISDEFQRREAEIAAAHQQAISGLYTSGLGEAAQQEIAASLERVRELQLEKVRSDRQKKADEELEKATKEAASELEKKSKELASWASSQLELVKTQEQKTQDYYDKLHLAMNAGLLDTSQVDALMAKFSEKFDSSQVLSRGTFNAAAIQGLQSGPALDRVAIATEATRKHTRGILDRVNAGGVFL